ncbi:beta-Ala-His dipeptidase [uncultured Victivallis sp.]|uniref:beta-Ala-His dipeptidase n=1 Tax=uncultured Victivallis sp. TaxID=354118 RepID=UPI0025FC5314|nr:beta-Ala-His dipeptidase [uncultured Victivallis sp.]
MTNTRRELPEPAPLWRIFENICSIPHPSGHEKALAEALSMFARERGLAVRSDSCGNLRIDRPASPGFEERPTVILQAHLDMVPQAGRGSSFDFTRDPIPTVIEDGWMRSAAGTTLGADDGIGVAAALALLTDGGFRSGPLAAVFTLSEEVGLNGAVALDPAFLKGDYLLNLDSEDEGELFIGCAGGARLEADFAIETRDVPAGVAGALLEVKGLAGGHSGCNIADRRGNAVRFLGLALKAAGEAVRVSSMHGGSLDNAIPREAEAVVVLKPEEFEPVRARLAALVERLQKENVLPEAFAIELAEAPLPETVWTDAFQSRIVRALADCPDGVLEMDARFGIPRTSTNLAAVLERDGMIVQRTSQRSLIDAERRTASERVADHFRRLGATVRVDSEYPGWTPAPESKLLKTASALYRELFGVEAKVKVIPAGLECGIFAGKRPGLDMISFGPTVVDPHSPAERVGLESVERFYSFLGALVSAL